MEKGKPEDTMGSVESDLTLICKIQEDNTDQESLIALVDRHSGIFHTMVNHFMSSPQCARRI